MTKKKEFNTETKRAAMMPTASLQDQVVRSIRASASGESVYQYEKRLKEMGIEF